MGEWHRDGDTVVAGGFALEDGEYSLKLVATAGGASTALPGGRGVVVLDTELTPELEAEGVARDLIRLVQQARRDAGFDVSDRIELTVGASERLQGQLAEHVAFIRSETLSTSLAWAGAESGGEMNTELDGEAVLIRVAKA